MGNLSNLVVLVLRDNELSGNIPSSIGNFSQAYTIDLSFNQLSGSVPASLSNLSQFVTLEINNNNFTFSGLENAGSLNFKFVYSPQADIPLIVDGNKFSVAAGGKLSNNVYKWFYNGNLVATLIEDSTYTKTFEGSYSVAVTNQFAPALTLYSIDSTNIQDSLALVDLFNSTNGHGWIKNTNWLTKAPVATWFGITSRNGFVTEIMLNDQFNGNNLTGSLPASIGNFKGIKKIDVSRNKITGPIPRSIGNLNNLSQLIFSNNLFTGAIPSVIFNMSVLSDFEIEHNQISGIPDSISNQGNLTVFLANNNQITGSIPSSIGKLTQLNQFRLASNQFSGSIPDSICNLINVFTFDLSNNNLSGKLPDSLGRLTRLAVLELNNNNLSGTIPTLSSSIIGLNLENNMFTFNGMENLPHSFSNQTIYSPQAKIPLTQNGNLISVTAGGTLANDTFHLYKNGLY